MHGVSAIHLLIVDDEASQMQALCATLRDEGFVTHGFTSSHEALETMKRRSFDLLLTDLMMPEMDGLALLRAALAIDENLVVILMTGNGTIGSAVEAMKGGALDYILKPFKLSTILPVLNRALAVRKLRLENAALELRVLERTSELEAANKELEAFSYSVSHDLRAPLRHMDMFANLLVEEFSADMPIEAQNHLKTITASAKRMGQLIEDLLQLSRLSRQPLSRKSVDIAKLAHSIVGDLKIRNADRNVNVQIEELPPCTGDASLLEQVFVNLLSNAFKFTRHKNPGSIEIGSRQEAGESVYFIRDNGAGFDMHYVDRIFGVFQRLHKADEFEGTGVGLSIVQRIIQRHGGRIWVNAAINEGAIFHFTLAAKPAP